MFTLGSTMSVCHSAVGGLPVFVYNALFFSATGLDGSQLHTVSWALIVMDTSMPVQVMLFNYAVMTSEEQCKGNLETPGVPLTSRTIK
ncbi:unnamed protein product [Mycena citricolor]|uniref:Uncharacterized protein n=1 Tax=Mycena citricolor TaxID=2018698 RepID=A0AAD2JW05_9AGAR|nr:unnamed protein product [Mycena citricolor]